MGGRCPEFAGRLNGEDRVSEPCTFDPSVAEPSAILSPVSTFDRAPTRQANGSRLADSLRGLVGRLDRCLRHLLGIEEFSTRPDCLLRVARALAGSRTAAALKAAL
jgi:hypothetical protein